MTPERYRRAERVFALAVEVGPHERKAVVERECGDDVALQREVLELLEADARDPSLIGVVGAAIDELAKTDPADVRVREMLDDLSVGIGDVVEGRYRIESVLGVGGMGAVVQATHVALNERVAMKLLKPSVVGSTRARERFLREARAAATLKSEHIVKMRDVGVMQSGAPYMVMEHLEGCDLKQLLERRQRLPTEEAVTIVLQACEALAAAHRAGIVHRDIKPANLFLERAAHGDVVVKLLDFGISKQTTEDQEVLTGTDDMLGSPAYMSPEQLRAARDVDERADIWSLGVVLYEALAGARPFRADSLADLTMVILMDPPAPLPDELAIAPDMAAVLYRSVAKEREERFESVAALAAALAPFTADGAERAARVARTLGKPLPTATSDATPTTKPPSRLPWLIGIGAMAIGGVWWAQSQKTPAPIPTEPDAVPAAEVTNAPSTSAVPVSTTTAVLTTTAVPTTTAAASPSVEPSAVPSVAPTPPPRPPPRVDPFGSRN